MTQIETLETDAETLLRQQAANFVSKANTGTDPNYNLASILLRLTGQQFNLDGRFSERPKMKEAKCVLDKALFVERKKARMKRWDYDANRHIALHQASKRLDDLFAMAPITSTG